MIALENELKANLQGEVYFDSITRHVYSVDASIFEIEPLGVVIPKNFADLQHIVEIAHHFRVPLTLRGAATGITGGCLGEGLIVDLSKYLTRIVSVNLAQEFAICEPGVIQDELNGQLAPFGYRLGPDTSTGNRATLGGMLANNAAGARSLFYGTMSDHVQSVELLLSTGKCLSFSSVTEEEWRNKCQQSDQEGNIYRILKEIQQQDADEIHKHFPPLPRRVSGYQLNELLKPGPFHVSRLIAGSEGTLGITTKIKMGIVPQPQAVGLLLIAFSDLLEALRHVPTLLDFHPLSLEMIDHHIIALGRASPSMRNRLEWLQGEPQVLLILEVAGQNAQDVEEKIHCLRFQIQQRQIGDTQVPLLAPIQMAHVWELRKAGLGILLSKCTYSRAVAFLEDISIPPLHLASFMEHFCAYLAKHGKAVGIYGHVGSGCMHVRPYLDLRDPQELVFMRQMMKDMSTFIARVRRSLKWRAWRWLDPLLVESQNVW